LFIKHIFPQQPDEEEEIRALEDFPDDAYLMVSQLHWEDEVVWNGDDIKHKVMSLVLMNI
jgi:transcription initiation factor TFIID subunit 1